MNDKQILKICDSVDEITPYIEVAPRGSRFRDGSELRDILAEVEPRIDWNIVGNWAQAFVEGDVPSDVDHNEVLRKIEEHFRNIDAWDDIEDPRFVDLNKE